MDTIPYTVKQGDTLWGIAQYFGTNVNDLARLNGIAFPDQIYPDQIINIPTANLTTPRYYVVRPGDTIWNIAGRYQLTLDDIVDRNNLADPNVLYPGQILRLRS